ncbi:MULTISPECIES: accessory Sec system protein translocase subunit SecY2 [unclassified Staphylococcus]|uniref:accessory Sec system protein translocase subunit SecY2 n=1 Tax=unclassified Staphylococcus TaxID=91994 RepID=UPI0025580D6D|nr:MULTISPECIES: accessory Sec system protein translocase subunit SecY2 [unclassified Staphylococcus]
MNNNFTKTFFKQIEYKVMYKRMLFTSLILIIYILGSNISIVAQETTQHDSHSFYKIAVANTGGDLNTLNIFTLGLGPWLTAMIIRSLLAYRDVDKASRQTRSERHYKEKLWTIILAIAQAYFVVNEYVSKGKIDTENTYILLLILITGTMLLVWLADQNVRYGIAGPMPIVLMSIVKSLFHQKLASLHTSTIVLILIIVVIAMALFILLYMELIEYRLKYRDIMNFSNDDIKKYLAWKVNPAGSITIMISISVFVLLSNIVGLILNTVIPDADINLKVLSFSNPIGITLYILIQIILGYFLSRFLLNTKNKSKEFLKNGNYFIGVKPGKETEQFLNRKAKNLCWFGSIVVALIIGIPLYSTLLIPQLAQQIYFAIQLIILVYIGINITETIRTYLYFDKYKDILNKYW